MARWDLLNDEPEPVPSAAPSSAWASLDDDGLQRDRIDGGAPTWQSLEDEPMLAEPGLPAPELTASQLKDGEVLWARADGQIVTLGSGQPLHVPAGVPDGIGGWRRVRILDAATLSAEVLVFPVEQPLLAVADEPTLLFPPDPGQPQPRRPPGFPVGEGGDLSAAFESRVRRSEQDYRNATQAAREDFQRRGDQLERQLREDYDRKTHVAEQQAESRYREAVQRVQRDAGHQVDQARQLARQNLDLRRRAEQERDGVLSELAKARSGRQLGLAAAAVGWLCVLALLVAVLQ